MQTVTRILALIAIGVLLGACTQEPDGAGKDQSFVGIVAAAEQREGFYNLYWHAGDGKLYLEIDDFDKPFLYVSWLARGVGSNDLGLDRGQLGDTRVARFQRVGPRVLLAQDNLAYRAESDDLDERAAVQQSFAFSVLGGFDIAAEAEDGRVLVDATAFFLRDAHGVADRLKAREEGDYKAAPDLSSIYLANTKAFPDNTEVEAIVTLTGKPTGQFLPTVVPDPTQLSVHIRHSLVRLPDDGYTPVPYEPRSGYFDPAFFGQFADYATPIHEPLQRAWLPRHRLAKKDPAAAMSEPVEPIVYYLDRGAPEPVRSALLEGARWWNQAFEAAGYQDAFRVEVLPEGADPMDVRYNIIQWVHRATRGWSYGASVRDPRSGEIIKGHVTLGSLRVRQDYLLGEGLLQPYGNDDRSAEVEAFALARLRQLSAHEVGHTLGIAHNFAASVNDRASVMDYPHPLLKLDANGEVDISDAYDVGIGEWDKRVVLYGYQDFPAGEDSQAGRAAILAATLDLGLHNVADADARSVGSAHPYGSLWDNGANAMDELDNLAAVRRAVLDRFSDAVIREGRPWAQIEEALVPMYLLHRYQVRAVGKYLGGQYFNYALRGDGLMPTEPVPADQQQRALELLLDTLSVDFLALSPELVRQIPPRPPGFAATRELFDRSTGSVFDPIAAAEASAQLTLEVLLNPQRAARMNRMSEQAAPGFMEVLEPLLARTWLKPPESELTALERAVNEQVLAGLLSLSRDPDATMHVRAQASWALQELLPLAQYRGSDLNRRAHYLAAKQLIEQAMEAPPPEDRKAPKPPPGSPIGLE